MQSLESSELDNFIQETAKDEKSQEKSANEPDSPGESQGEVEAESMSMDDAIMIVGGGVGYLEDGLSFVLGAPIKFEDDQERELVKKGAPVAKKYLGNISGNSFFIKFREEIMFGATLGGMVWGAFRQAKQFKRQQKEIEKTPQEQMTEELLSSTRPENPKPIFEATPKNVTLDLP